MTNLFWTLFVYCLVERLVEIVVSRRNQGRMRAKGFVERETSLGMNSMIIMHTAWFVSLLIEAHVFPSGISSGIRLLAAGIFIAAQALRWWTLRTLGHFWNVSVLTNARDERAFVSSGPYRFIRHPNYLVVIVELASLPIVGGAPLTAIVFSVLNGLLLRRRIGLEERSLFAIPGYERMMSHKPRLSPRCRGLWIS
jgi:methyltransferase